VPLSLGWDGVKVILSVDRPSVTARNIAASGRARLALGETGDVVMIDARLEKAVSGFSGLTWTAGRNEP
jgi:hypothetical protein